MATPKNIKMTINKVPQIAAGIKLLATTRVMVGVPGNVANRKGEDDGPINNAALMYIHENGAPEANIPARPVVHPTVTEEQSSIEAGMRKAGEAALDGDASGVDKSMHAVGIRMQNAMRRKITVGPFAPLSPRTLAARAAKGHKSTKPLIDTGQLRRALTYVLRKVRWSTNLFKGTP